MGYIPRISITQQNFPGPTDITWWSLMVISPPSIGRQHLFSKPSWWPDPQSLPDHFNRREFYPPKNAHIARSTAPSGVNTEDPITKPASINCIAFGIRDHWEVANLEEKKREKLSEESSVKSEPITQIACFLFTASFDHVHFIHAGAGWTDRTFWWLGQAWDSYVVTWPVSYPLQSLI